MPGENNGKVQAQIPGSSSSALIHKKPSNQEGLEESSKSGGVAPSSSLRRKRRKRKEHVGSSSPSTSSEEDRSKLELECQFHGIDLDPDADTADLELDEEDNNDSNGHSHDTGGLPNPHRRPNASCSPASPYPFMEDIGGGSMVGGFGGGGSPVSLVEEDKTSSSNPPVPHSQSQPPTFSAPSSQRGSRSGRGGDDDLEDGPEAEELGEGEGDGAEGGETQVITLPEGSSLIQQCLFYITAFFILLATFSLFAFLFLVPFVIDPAFTTIFMEFDPTPATCQTVSTVRLSGATKCEWTSCREGCTREIFNCTQININYKISPLSTAHPHPLLSNSRGGDKSTASKNGASSSSSGHSGSGGGSSTSREHVGGGGTSRGKGGKDRTKHKEHSKETSKELSKEPQVHVYKPHPSGWDFVGARLYPNVKGCGYPPVVVCSTFFEQYGKIGTNFSCYYSRVNPTMVVTTFDMSRVTLSLIFAMAVPIPAFIISVVYLIFAYFRIYNTEASPPKELTPPGPRSQPSGTSQSSTNNNLAGGGGLAGETIDEEDEGETVVMKGNSKMVPNNNRETFEMNDLNPGLHNNSNSGPPDGDLLRRNPNNAMSTNNMAPVIGRNNNRAPERNGPSNPNAKNRGRSGSHSHSRRCSGGSGSGSGSRRGSSPPLFEALKYLEPGVLPEKKPLPTLPPIQLPQQLQPTSPKASSSSTIDWKRPE